MNMKTNAIFYTFLFIVLFFRKKKSFFETVSAESPKKDETLFNF